MKKVYKYSLITISVACITLSIEHVYYSCYPKKEIHALIDGISDTVQFNIYGYTKKDLYEHLKHDSWRFEVEYSGKTVCLLSDGGVYVDGEMIYVDKEITEKYILDMFELGIFNISEKTLFFKNYLSNREFLPSEGVLSPLTVSATLWIEESKLYVLLLHASAEGEKFAKLPDIKLVVEMIDKLDALGIDGQIWPIYL